ncbi:hypothetical protein GCM10010156_52740 [Planobispora rosea]|uniref:Uncharacterized protein n=1 Tax=Planobispora rosea TaxID=35762 RepID=A0A8J3S645_PLARO|nr:hypothetical protein [Planobispora rosea]GGS87673.1 hypothetical protein GCM10010156_52740 [Planobispora rosea]GIH86676.1 hypothetical protein Pro02_50840 [Planobispora rosea]
MFVTYRPEDGAEQKWIFDPRRVRASQAEAIEKRAGEPWDAWLVAVQAGNMRARRVLLWHLLRLDHPALKFEDVPDFYAGELVVEHSVAELTEIRGRVTKAPLPAAQREQVLAAIDTALGEAREREQTTEPEGKALSPSGANATP